LSMKFRKSAIYSTRLQRRRSSYISAAGSTGCFVSNIGRPQSHSIIDIQFLVCQFYSWSLKDNSLAINSPSSCPFNPHCLSHLFHYPPRAQIIPPHHESECLSHLLIYFAKFRICIVSHYRSTSDEAICTINRN